MEFTTDDGRKIILNTDGTWNYKESIAAEMTPATVTTAINNTYSCDDLLSYEEDKMTGKTTYGAKESLILSKDGKNGFNILAFKSKKITALSIVVVGASICIKETSKANILFRDGTRLELGNRGKFNCNGKFNIYMGGAMGNKKALEEMRSKQIETMRIWTSRGHVQEDFSEDESMKLMTLIDCLSK